MTPSLPFRPTRLAPADAAKSRKQSRALAERTLAEKGVGPEGKAAVATVLFTMALCPGLGDGSAPGAFFFWCLCTFPHFR